MVVRRATPPLEPDAAFAAPRQVAVVAAVKEINGEADDEPDGNARPTKEKRGHPGSPSLGRRLGGVLHALGGRGAGLRLQPVEIIGGLLRVAGGGEDRPLVVFQDFQP